jgi:hypothetical protein
VKNKLMLNKILLGSAAIWVIVVSASIVALSVHASQQGQGWSTHFTNGFPVQQGWKEGKFVPPMLTLEQLTKQEESLKTLEDKDEIQSLLYAFVFFHDTGNTLGMRSTFTKDGGIGGGYNNDGKEIVGPGCIGTYMDVGLSAVDTNGVVAPKGAKEQVVYPFPGHSKNITTNVAIQVHGDTAELHAYYTRVQANVDGQPPVAPDAGHTADVMYTGQYVMDVVRTPEGWRFLRQWHINDWRNTSGPNGRATRTCN